MAAVFYRQVTPNGVKQGIRSFETNAGEDTSRVSLKPHRTKIEMPPAAGQFILHLFTFHLFNPFNQSNQMPQLFPLRLKIFRIVRVRLDANRDLLDNFKAITFEPDDLLRIIGEQANRFDTEIHKNLRA